jgi:hypothetical protein
MKVVSLRKYKDVMYMGQKFNIPAEHEHMAVDSWGELHSFIEKPKALIEEGYWDNPTGDLFELVGRVDLEGEAWYNSHREVYEINKTE